MKYINAALYVLCICCGLMFGTAMGFVYSPQLNRLTGLYKPAEVYHHYPIYVGLCFQYFQYKGMNMERLKDDPTHFEALCNKGL